MYVSRTSIIRVIITLRTDRFGWAFMVVLGSCWLLVACVGSTNVLPAEPTGVGHSPSQQATSEAPTGNSGARWPSYGRDVIEVEETSVEWTSRLVSGISQYEANVFGEMEFAVWDIDDPRTVQIHSVQNGSSVDPDWTYTVTSEDRYVALIAFVGTNTAYLAEAPPVELIELEGPGSRLVHVDLATRDVHEVSPPDGTLWSPWGAFIEAGPTGVYAVARSAGIGDCVVRIDGVDTEILTCFEGQQVSFSTISGDGLSVLTFPWGDNMSGCRQRWQISADDGKSTSIGPDGACNRFDGVMLDGWSIWSEIDPEEPAQFYQAGMLADGPDGQQISFGLMRTGSMTVCGSYVFWQTQVPTAGWSAYETLRWRPGMDHVESLREDTTPDVYSGPPRCVSGGTVNITEVSSLAEPPTEEFLTLPANAP